MMNQLHASWYDLSAEQQPFVFYSKKRDNLIVCDSKVNIQISTDYTADIKVNIAIFEYGGIGTKKFQFDNPTESDGSYTPKSVVLLYKPYGIDLEFCHSDCESKSNRRKPRGVSGCQIISAHSTHSTVKTYIYFFVDPLQINSRA